MYNEKEKPRWISRLEEDRSRLEFKIDKDKIFLERFAVSKDDRAIIEMQVAAMITYAMTLEIRINSYNRGSNRRSPMFED